MTDSRRSSRDESKRKINWPKAGVLTAIALGGLCSFTQVRYRSSPLLLLLRPVWKTHTYMDDSADSSRDPALFSQLQFGKDGEVLIGSGDVSQLWAVPSLEPTRRISDSSLQIRSSIAVSHEANRIVTAGSAPAVQFWDAATGEVKTVLTDTDSLIDLPVLSKDGKQLAGYRRTKTSFQAVVYDLETQQNKTLAIEGLSEVSAIAFSPSGQQLAIASETTLQLWDLAQQQIIHSIAIAPSKLASEAASEATNTTTEKQDTTRIQFSPDGQTITVWGYQRDQQQIAIASGQITNISESIVSQYPVSALSPNGQTIARIVGTKGRYDLEIVTVTSGEIIERFRGVGKLIGLAFSPEGKTLVSYEDSGYIALRQLGGPSTKTKIDLAHVETARGSAKEVYGITYSADGKMLVVNNATSVITLIEANTGKTRHQIPTDLLVKKSRLSPDGQTLMTSALAPTLKSWDSSRDQLTPQGSLLLPRSISHTTISPDGEMFVAASSAASWTTSSTSDVYQLLIGRTQTGDILHTIDMSVPVAQLVYSPDGKAFAAVSNNGQRVQLWNAETGNELHRLTHSGNNTFSRSSVSFSADGTVVAVQNEDFATAWETETGDRLQTFTRNVDAERYDDFRDIAVSPDGRWIAISQSNSAIAIWDSQSGKKVREIPTAETMRAIAFSPDGRTLAGIEYSERVTLWRLPSTFSLL